MLSSKTMPSFLVPKLENLTNVIQTALGVSLRCAGCLPSLISVFGLAPGLCHIKLCPSQGEIDENLPHRPSDIIFSGYGLFNKEYFFIKLLTNLNFPSRNWWVYFTRLLTGF